MMLTEKDMAARGKDTSKLHLIGDMNRLGVGLFNVRMEYTHFPPRSRENNFFEIILSRWPDPSFLWAIFSFPIEYREKAELIAKECGLRFADGIPLLLSGNEKKYFPLNGPTVYTLENVSNHLVYNNDQIQIENLKKEERIAIDEIINGDTVKLHYEMKNKGYSDEQIKRILDHWDSGDETYDEVPANPVN